MDQPNNAITESVPATPAVAVPPKAPALASPWTPPLILSAGLIAILAYFLASFRPQNSDLWMTLATGKLIAAGQYEFGKDPFSWASDGAFWANPTWLSSLIAYAIYVLFGAAALLFVKAILIVATTGLVFAARVKETPLLPALELTALTLLVASSRMFLQPLMVSYLMTAALMAMLVRDGILGGAEASRPAPRPMWHIPLLFLAWANLDGFFALGFFVLAATAIGLAASAETRGDAKRIGGILGLSIIASILNPHLLANLALPTDLAYVFRDVLPEAWTASGHVAAALDQGDPGFYPMVSPFSSAAIAAGGYNNTLAGVAFYVFVLINVVSFVVAVFVPGKRALFARALLCLVFVVLAGIQIRLIPFYALVAGPITTLNFADYARWARIRDSAPRRGVAFAAWTTCIALAGLVFFAWPGWLHLSFPQFRDDALFTSSRRVEFIFQPDPSLQRAAESLGAARQRGEIGNVYNFAPEIAHYCAFFASEVKCGIDQRFALFLGRAKDYAAARNDLWDETNEAVQPKEKLPPAPVDRVWPKLFADWRIDAVAVTGYHRLMASRAAPQATMVHAFYRQPKTWKLTYGDNQSILFDYSAAGAFDVDAPLIAWRKAAFAPQPESTWLAEIPHAPPRELRWLDKYFRGLGQTPLETSAAVFEMDAFLRYSSSWQDAYYLTFQSMHALPAAGHAGVVPGHVLGLNAAFLMRLGDEVLRRPVGSDPHWFHSVDAGPASLPILAQRNLRRSLYENVNIAGTHFWIAHNVRTVLKQEAWWTRHQLAPMRIQLRQLEIAAALQNAVTLAPFSPTYQMQYAELLLSNNYIDAAVIHYHEALQRIEIPKGIDPAQQKEVEALMRRQKLLERELKRRMDDYELKAAGVSEMDRVRLAVVTPWRFTDLDGKNQEEPRGRGLILEALRVLQRINPETLNEQEKAERANYLVRLNCFIGNINQAAYWFNSLKSDLGRFAPEGSLWIAAATGWYENIDATLELFEKDAAPARQAVDVARLLMPSLEQIAQLPHQPLIARVPAIITSQTQYIFTTEIVSRAAGRVCELRTLRGIYALERGDVQSARNHFDVALRGDIPFPDRPIAERYRELIDQAAK
jgi:hypothetical protein